MIVFISYANEDLAEFHIPEIVDYLEIQPDIDKVYYWERDNDSSQSILDFMEQKIQLSDVILVISSSYSLKSQPVKTEIDFAYQEGKGIIPIFKNIDEVRPIIKINRGIKFQDDNFQTFLEELYAIIAGKSYTESNLLREKKKAQKQFDKLKRMINKLFNLRKNNCHKFTVDLLKSEEMQHYFGVEVRDKEYIENQFVGFLDGLYFIIPNSRTLRYNDKMNNTILTFNTLSSMSEEEIQEKLDIFFKDIVQYVKEEFDLDLD
ncbi:MAG: hypothetical protein CEE42_07040 [Promethearchaeota archaeon Loki_b31]|nr:MAG: hypothetical protein CEE42_07040 [Candidatus Lokiarchaeota archaeon Loki_b31]